MSGRLLRIVELDTPNEFRTTATLRHLHNRVKSFTSQVSDRSRHLRTSDAPPHLRHPDVISPHSDPNDASPPRTRRAPTSLTGGAHPCSSQPSFRSRLCHWPQAGILPHQIQSQVAQRTHITLSSSHHPQHPVPTPVPIPDPETPPPVSITAPVHSPHSQQESQA